MNDPNWYTTEQPHNGKQKDYLWVWLLVGFFCVVAGALGIIWFAMDYLEDQGGFQQWANSVASFDDTQPAEFDTEQVIDRISNASHQLNNTQVAGEGVSEAAVAELNEAMETLQDIVFTADDDRFSAFIDHQAFANRVKNSRCISQTAKAQFQFQFRDWMELYLPVGPGTFSVQRITSGNSPDEFVVYAWVNNAGDYPEPAAWYFQKLQGAMKLVDYALLDEVELASERVAREFSAAFTGTLWDNYLAIFETDYFTIDRDAAIDEVERLSEQPFPNSVRHRGLLYLAQYADMLEAHQLALTILDKLTGTSVVGAIDLPAVHMIRA